MPRTSADSGLENWVVWVVWFGIVEFDCSNLPGLENCVVWGLHVISRPKLR